MQTGLERLRLRWQMWGATGREKWRLGWQLWIATLRWWLSEWHVRICLARHCVAIYRREWTHHRYESAKMRLGFWEDKCAEARENRWESAAESVSLANPETPDVIALGIPWRIWGRLSVVSWLLLIPVSWAWVFLTRGGMEVLGFGLFALWLALAVCWNGVPGTKALLNPVVRERLLYLPEAAALACLTLSAAVGLCGGFLACLHLEIGVGTALSGIRFGILFFPLSFGLVFPLGVPLVCCITVWRLAKTYGRMPRMGYALLSGVSAVGWMGVALIGPVVGDAG